MVDAVHHVSLIYLSTVRLCIELDVKPYTLATTERATRDTPTFTVSGSQMMRRRAEEVTDRSREYRPRVRK
jgi:hypothetical protein